MAGMFTGRPGESDAMSETDETPVVGGGRASGTAAGSGGYGGAHVRKGAVTTVLKGRAPVTKDPRKYKYDVVRGGASKLSFAVTKDDRMSAEEAAETLDNIHRIMGVDRETEDVLDAFDRALWFWHTVNSGSTLVPGRSSFSVVGKTVEFNSAELRNKLGVDMRRFFRAYADDIAETNQQVIDEYDPADFSKAEHHGWLMQVAQTRGLSRMPHLAHDSAEACIKISLVERAALAQSKAMVVSSTNNTADRLKVNDRVQSADNYDIAN